MTHVRTRSLYGGRQWNVPSRFVGEIPPEVTDAAEQPSARRTASTWSGSGSGPGFGGPTPPAPAPARATPVAGATFELGDDVVHAKFGEGVVIDFKGRGLDASVQVRFATQGTKWLALQYAKLTAV